MAKVVDTLMACSDCLTCVANGELPEDDTGQLEAAIGEYLDLSIHQHLVCGDSDQDDEFSWSQCECCGSKLGGSRHQLVLLEDDHAPSYGWPLQRGEAARGADTTATVDNSDTTLPVCSTPHADNDYPFCDTTKCPHWRGYCTRDPACND